MKTPPIVETSNPAAVAWSLKSNPDMQVCWTRHARAFHVGFRREGRWFNTSITNPAYAVHSGTLAEAREKAHAFLLEGSV